MARTQAGKDLPKMKKRIASFKPKLEAAKVAVDGWLKELGTNVLQDEFKEVKGNINAGLAEVMQLEELAAQASDIKLSEQAKERKVDDLNAALGGSAVNIAKVLRQKVELHIKVIVAKTDALKAQLDETKKTVEGWLADDTNAAFQTELKHSIVIINAGLDEVKYIQEKAEAAAAAAGKEDTDKGEIQAKVAALEAGLEHLTCDVVGVKGVFLEKAELQIKVVAAAEIDALKVQLDEAKRTIAELSEKNEELSEQKKELSEQKEELERECKRLKSIHDPSSEDAAGESIDDDTDDDQLPTVEQLAAFDAPPKKKNRAKYHLPNGPFMLSNLYRVIESGDFNKIIVWINDGQAFQIIDKPRFQNEILKVSNVTGSKSRNWFSNIASSGLRRFSVDENTYHHPKGYFVKGRPELCPLGYMENKTSEQALRIWNGPLKQGTIYEGQKPEKPKELGEED